MKKEDPRKKIEEGRTKIEEGSRRFFFARCSRRGARLGVTQGRWSRLFLLPCVVQSLSAVLPEALCPFLVLRRLFPVGWRWVREFASIAAVL